MPPLEAADIDVHLMLRGLVHELRNPLSAILTASSLLLHNGDPEDETTVLLDIVQKEAKRLNRILLEFTSFVKPPPPVPENVDLTDLLIVILADLEGENRIRKQTRVHNSLPDPLPVFADKDGVRRAITCLLINALEALPTEGGDIFIESAQKDAQVQLVIRDNGAGLVDGSRDQAFQPFFSTKPQATGLGLSIARVAARASGGDVDLTDAPGGGVRAILSLPAPSDSRVATS
jgi:signal transduction histidine kinase